MVNLTWVGIIIGVIGQGVSALGLILQKKAHAIAEAKTKKNGGKKKKYVCDPRWLVAFLIFFAGNMMSVVALALAPQSIISALVVLVLVFNAIFAPLLLENEKIQLIDIVGIIIIIGGIVLTIIFGAKSDRNWSANELAHNFIETAFLIYGAIIIILISILIGFNHWVEKAVVRGEKKWKDPHVRIGRFTAFTFAILPAILSSFNALFSKICGELVLTTAKGDNQFVKWQTYLFIAVFIVVDVAQIIYLQRALKGFSALLIIPLYQVCLTVFGVTSGGIYFKEFWNFDDKPTYYPIIFVLGILISIVGVFVLTRRNFDAVNPVEDPESQKPSSATSPECKRMREKGIEFSETSSGDVSEFDKEDETPPISTGTLLLFLAFRGISSLTRNNFHQNSQQYHHQQNTTTTPGQQGTNQPVHHHHHYLVTPPPQSMTQQQQNQTTNTINTETPTPTTSK